MKKAVSSCGNGDVGYYASHFDNGDWPKYASRCYGVCLRGDYFA